MNEHKLQEGPPDPHQTRAIAVRACVHPRTVVRCYRGERVRSTVAARVVAAARELSFPEPRVLVAGAYPWTK